ncbi:MAG TPA: hypothetical protein VHC69_31160 [Polyangiaceae bacterium]|nr:hypothetical protein [Polyangiaceae bacterium]
MLWQWGVARTNTWINQGILWGGGLCGIWNGPSTPSYQEVIAAGHNTVSTVPVGSWARFEALFNNATTDYLKAGSTSVTGQSNGTPGSFSATWLASNSTPALFWAGSLAAHLMTIGQPTAAEKAALTAAAARKYGTGVLV